MYNSLIVADRIKKMVDLRNKSLKSVFENCGMGRNTMANLTGGSMPKGDNLAKIADYLDCSVDYLLGRTEYITDSSSNVTSVPLTDECEELIEEYRKLDLKGKNKVYNTIIQEQERMTSAGDTETNRFVG